MIGVGRFDLDESHARAVSHLLRCAWIPRSHGERARLAAARVAARLGLRPALSLLARPAREVAEAPSHAEALEAARALLSGVGVTASLTSGLSLAQAAHATGSRRLLFVWRADEPLPFAVAKVALPAGAQVLAIEARSHERVARLTPDVAEGCPAILAHGSREGLAVLVQQAVPGPTLARQHALRWRAGTWPSAAWAAAGRWLGQLHAATAQRADGRCTAAVHGDAWSRNVVVSTAPGDAARARVTFLDFEAFREGGDPVAELVFFVVASAEADLAGRGEDAEARRASVERVASWCLLPGTQAFAATRAFFDSWRAAAGEACGGGQLAETAVEALAAIAGQRGQTLSTACRAALLGRESALRGGGAAA